MLHDFTERKVYQNIVNEKLPRDKSVSYTKVSQFTYSSAVCSFVALLYYKTKHATLDK